MNRYVLRDWLSFVCCQGYVVGPKYLVLCVCVYLENVEKFSQVGIHKRSKSSVCFRVFLFGLVMFSCFFFVGEELLKGETL